MPGEVRRPEASTGKQAECYANDFIGEHVKDAAGGKTYAELGGPERALHAKVAAAQKANDPALPDLQKQHAALKGRRDSLFQGRPPAACSSRRSASTYSAPWRSRRPRWPNGVAALLALLSVAGLVRGLRSARTRTVTEPAPKKAILGDKHLVEA